ncbi:pre-mRNA-splicing factor ATP-dependent RNA helicase Prp16p [Diutina catenulata]
MDAVKQILNDQLNRDVNERFVETILSFYNASKTTEEFADKCKVVGVPDAAPVYDAIDNNIGTVKRRKPVDAPGVVLDFNEEAELMVPVAKKAKRGFKRINKEEAKRRSQRIEDDGLKVVKPSSQATCKDVEPVQHPAFKKTSVQTQSPKSIVLEKGVLHGPSTSDDVSRLHLIPHFHVPPFLADSSQFLSANLKKIGPLVDPVKNANSELAVEAREGSHLVQERKVTKERRKKIDSMIGKEEAETNEPEEKAPTPPPAENITEVRRSLPVFSVRDDLVRTISENQVTIVVGETGSGKTTQLAQYLYEDGFCRELKIACTQPRRVAAQSVARRVADEVGCKLGTDVGYSVRFDDQTSPSTKIRFMTDGILLREILGDPMLSEYSVIIMDEAHERSLNTDILLGLFKKLLVRRPDLKLVVTSATMNAERFSQFFGGAPNFFIPGRTFPVEVLYSQAANGDYVESAIKQVLTIHLSTTTNDGDILVFMTGQDDIDTMCEVLRERLDSVDNPPPLKILPIYSSLPPEQQSKIFVSSPHRKVVVATNIAETSLTIDGIRYVIDTGLVKMNVYSAKLGMDVLRVVPVSLANANQRSGRAGRTGPGVGYRLFTERSTSSEMMFAQPIPEIQRTNLANVMLLLKSLKVEDIKRFPFLDPPPNDLLHCSLYDLWSLTALDNHGQLTYLGEIMTQFPIEPALSRCLVLSAMPQFHCSDQMITIVAMLSLGTSQVFLRPKERAAEADSIREKFVIPESDHLTLLNVYNQWANQRQREKWCSKNFINSKSLARAHEVRRQIQQIMDKMHFDVLKGSEDDVRRCLCASFFFSAAKVERVNPNSGSSEFSSLRHSYMKLFLHPTSVLVGANLSSPYVIYHSLMMTKREYISCVTVVEPIWLLEYGSVYYDLAANQKQRYEIETRNLGRELEEAARQTPIARDVSNELSVKKSISRRAL